MPLQQDQEGTERGAALKEIRLVERSVGDRLTMVSTQVSLLQAQATRIEDKLDRLLGALAEDEQDDEPGHDLDGNPLPADRDPNEPL